MKTTKTNNKIMNTKLIKKWKCIQVTFMTFIIFFGTVETPNKTSQDNLIEMSRNLMGGSSLLYVTSRTSLVTIGILIVKRKISSSKTPIL